MVGYSSFLVTDGASAAALPAVFPHEQQHPGAAGVALALPVEQRGGEELVAVAGGGEKRAWLLLRLGWLFVG